MRDAVSSTHLSQQVTKMSRVKSKDRHADATSAPKRRRGRPSLDPKGAMTPAERQRRMRERRSLRSVGLSSEAHQSLQMHADARKLPLSEALEVVLREAVGVDPARLKQYGGSVPGTLLLISDAIRALRTSKPLCIEALAEAMERAVKALLTQMVEARLRCPDPLDQETSGQNGGSVPRMTAAIAELIVDEDDDDWIGPTRASYTARLNERKRSPGRSRYEEECEFRIELRKMAEAVREDADVRGDPSIRRAAHEGATNLLDALRETKEHADGGASQVGELRSSSAAPSSRKARHRSEGRSRKRSRDQAQRTHLEPQ